MPYVLPFCLILSLSHKVLEGVLTEIARLQEAGANDLGESEESETEERYASDEDTARQHKTSS